MRADVLWRKVHYWLSMISAIPILVTICTGLVLHVKKDFHWIQPNEQRGSGTVPRVTFEQILVACQQQSAVDVDGWEDIHRVDLDPDDGLLKVTTRQRWEIQVDATTGDVLQVAARRSDMIESLHDGSWFGKVVQRWVFLPAGVMLLVLWVTGIYLFVLPQLRSRRRKLQP